jgi:hypothetical protein
VVFFSQMSYRNHILSISALPWGGIPSISYHYRTDYLSYYYEGSYP